MPKALCLISLVASILVIALFLIDALMALLGMGKNAPLYGANIVMDIGFVVFGGLLAFMSWTTYREQR